jgi:hypothetical protein
MRVSSEWGGALSMDGSDHKQPEDTHERHTRLAADGKLLPLEERLRAQPALSEQRWKSSARTPGTEARIVGTPHWSGQGALGSPTVGHHSAHGPPLAPQDPREAAIFARVAQPPLVLGGIERHLDRHEALEARVGPHQSSRCLGSSRIR